MGQNGSHLVPVKIGWVGSTQKHIFCLKNLINELNYDYGKIFSQIHKDNLNFRIT